MTHPVSYGAEGNARLLVKMKEMLGASEIGAITGFFDVEPYWRCPCCYRSKMEIARLDRHNNLLCAIVQHHDHFTDNVPAHLSKRGIERQHDPDAFDAIEKSFERFSRLSICQDCNVAEPQAKAMVGAGRAFSFAPHEIAGFIKVSPNNPHEIDRGRAQEIYDSLKPAMQQLASRLRAIGRASIDECEPIAQAAWRVLKDARRGLKEAAE